MSDRIIETLRTAIDDYESRRLAKLGRLEAKFRRILERNDLDRERKRNALMGLLRVHEARREACADPNSAMVNTAGGYRERTR